MNEHATSPQATAPAPVATENTPPPAASTVLAAPPGVESSVAETLRAELAAEKEKHAATAAQRRERETRIAELEKELQGLRAAQRAPRQPLPKDRWLLIGGE